ncbi:MAG: hypothetical protein EBR02_01945 [Alphaproteobacteria bacterium]|nr:hypothetical protein [Alphaproteobacteria bacterium]
MSEEGEKSYTGEKVKHVLTSTLKGAVKGVAWGIAAVAGAYALDALIAIAIPGGLLVKGLTALVGFFYTHASTTTIITAIAKVGAALGFADGISTTDSVQMQQEMIQQRKVASAMRNQAFAQQMERTTGLAVENQRLMHGLGGVGKGQGAGMEMAT